MNNRSSQDDLPTTGTTNTQTFLETSVFDVDHKALEEHLVSNPVQQSDLDRCLLRGLQIVLRRKKELSHVAQALTRLLQSGAKWNSDILLDDQKTPYHIICESSGDHYNLLDLLIESSPRTIIDTQDIYKRTALLYAVRNANSNCVKCLITNGADINITDDSYLYQVRGEQPQRFSLICEIIMKVRYRTEHRFVNEYIFDLLLDKYPIEFYEPLIIFAIARHSFYCTRKLIEKGTHLEVIDNNKRYLWSRVASLGCVELLKCMFNHGIDKDTTDQNGLSVLWYVVNSGEIEAVRYLLDLGVVIPSYTPEVLETQCDQCKENTLIVDDIKREDPVNEDPCMRAICDMDMYDGVEIVNLLEEHGNQSCKSFNALRRAVLYGSENMTLYLLNNFKYPLNIEYTKKSDPSGSTYTLLTEPRLLEGNVLVAVMTQLLLDHGVDPAKQMCSATSVNAMMSALASGNLKVIAQYIHSGVDISFKSYDHSYGHIFPFESSSLRGYHKVAEILLISGCSCGVFSLNNNHKFKNNLNPEVEKLMKEWKVQENNATPLRQRCRNVILNHLSPRADIKIGKLPLPRLLIKFLGLSEIDEIVDAQKYIG